MCTSSASIFESLNAMGRTLFRTIMSPSWAAEPKAGLWASSVLTNATGFWMPLFRSSARSLLPDLNALILRL